MEKNSSSFVEHFETYMVMNSVFIQSIKLTIPCAVDRHKNLGQILHFLKTPEKIILVRAKVTNFMDFSTFGHKVQHLHVLYRTKSHLLKGQQNITGFFIASSYICGSTCFYLESKIQFIQITFNNFHGKRPSQRNIY